MKKYFLHSFTLLLTFLIFTQLSTSIAQADRTFLSEYTQVLYDKSNGLVTNDTNDILQTSDGYIWIASYSGLIQYDGDTFVQYSSLLGNFPSSRSEERRVGKEC